MAPPNLQIDPISINQELKDVLQGPSFRSSNQCQAMLRYIVEHTVAGDDDLLRERVIGTQVFGRAPDYDTGVDPIVRSRAGEVRKRLAQHYLRGAGSGYVRIDVPSGSYHATFEIPGIGVIATDPAESRSVEPVMDHPSAADSQETLTGPHKEQAATKLSFFKMRLYLGLAALGAVCCLGLYATLSANQNDRAFNNFWAPIVHNSRPVILYIGANYAYRLSNQFLDNYRNEHHLVNRGPEFFIDLQKGEMIDEGDLSPTNHLIGFGDVASSAKIVSTLTRLNKNYDLRYGNDIAITDLRSGPTILIGGFSNTWTLEIMQDLRYVLETGDRITDRSNRNKAWVDISDHHDVRDDYAVVSRLFKSETGDFVLVIAGINTYGNQASAEFLSDPNQIGALMNTLPDGWQRKNLQIVLHTHVVNQVPTIVNVEAIYVW